MQGGKQGTVVLETCACLKLFFPIADLAHMYPFNQYNFFLLLVEAFSRKLFTQCLKTKSKSEVQRALKDIIMQNNLIIENFQSDAGREFVSQKDFFQANKIHFTVMSGKNKAALAEAAIGRVKLHLYKALRSSGTKDWPSLLPQIVDNLNKTPLLQLGWRTPASIKSLLDEPRVCEEQRRVMQEMDMKKREKVFSPNTSYSNMKANEQAYNKSKHDITVGDYVMLATGQDSALSKSYDTQVSFNAQIS